MRRDPHSPIGERHGHWAEQVRPVDDPYEEGYDADDVEAICYRQRRAADYARAVGAHWDERPTRAKAGWG